MRHETDTIFCSDTEAEKLTGCIESESKQKHMLDILQIEEIGIKTLLPNLIVKTLLGETVSCLVEDDLILVNRKGEKEVLHMRVKGSSTKEIAFDLNINTRTVEAHRQKMMAKLNVVNMTMLVSFSVTHKLVTTD